MTNAKDHPQKNNLPPLQVDKQAPVVKKQSKASTTSAPSSDYDEIGRQMDSSNKGKGPSGENL